MVPTEGEEESEGEESEGEDKQAEGDQQPAERAEEPQQEAQEVPADPEAETPPGRRPGRRARGARPKGRPRPTRPGTRPPEGPRGPRPAQGALAELVIIVAVALGLALGIQAFIVKPYKIPSESMEPTLDVGQRVLVNRFLYRFSDPAINDIIVFHPPRGARKTARSAASRATGGAALSGATQGRADVNFIKRIVAGPGDTLSIEDGHPVVNGEVAEEDFIRKCSPGSECNLPQEIVIPRRTTTS